MSHRAHYDPRIYHLMAVFRQEGFHVVLFDPPPDQHASIEWAEWVEPAWHERRLDVVTTALADLDGDLQAAIRRAVDSGGQGERLASADGVSYRRSTDGRHVSLVLHQERTDRYFSYSTRSPEEVRTAALPTSPMLRQAVYLASLAEHRTDPAFAAVLEQLRRWKGYTLHECGSRIALVREGRFDHGHEIQIDLETGRVRERRLPRRYDEEPDVFMGHEHDFTAYRKGVYEFTWELDLLRSYLETSPAMPHTIVVANLPTLPIGLMLKQACGARLVVDCHEWWSAAHGIWYPEETEKIARIDSYERELYAACDAAMTVSETLADAMSRHFSRPFAYVPTCVFDEPDTDARENGFWMRHAGLPEGAKVALFQGGLSAHRNLENLMRASRRLRDDQFIVICGDGKFRAEMDQVLTADGDPGRVRFLGWKPQLDLWRYTVHADLGVIPYSHDLPYYRFSAPNKLSEYHVCRLPMLVDEKMTELRSVVERDGIGRVAALSDADAMGDAVRTLLDDEQTLAACRRRYLDAPERFTRRACRRYLQPVLGELS